MRLCTEQDGKVSEVVALADGHGGVEACLTAFPRPPPWVKDGSRTISESIIDLHDMYPT